MSAHSGGHWYQTLTPHIVGARDLIGGYHTIARCEIGGSISPEEAAANARLIAAAPDLLAALVDLLDYAADCASEQEERPACLEKARAAIRAATGAA